MGNSPSWGANEPPWDSFLAKAPPSWRFSAKAAPNLELLCLNSNFCSIDLPGSFLSHSMENMLRVQFPTWLFWGLYLFILNFSALAGSSLEHENYSWAGFFAVYYPGCHHCQTRPTQISLGIGIKVQEKREEKQENGAVWPPKGALQWHTPSPQKKR